MGYSYERAKYRRGLVQSMKCYYHLLSARRSFMHPEFDAGLPQQTLLVDEASSNLVISIH
jgi:hypothetical protein